MKQLSLKSINDKAPLEVSLTTSGTFTLSRVSICIDGISYYASLLISNSNPSYGKILNAFNNFASGFSYKVENI